MEVVDATDLEVVRSLFLEYQQALLEVGVDLFAIQPFAEELAALPGKYAAVARGALLFAMHEG